MKWGSLGSMNSAKFWAIAIGLLIVTSLVPCHAQSLPPLRGGYTPGFSATNSGVMPDPGLTCSNTFMDYSFNQIRCTACGTLGSKFAAAVFLDVSVFMWLRNGRVPAVEHYHGREAFFCETHQHMSSSRLDIRQPQQRTGRCVQVPNP